MFCECVVNFFDVKPVRAPTVWFVLCLLRKIREDVYLHRISRQLMNWSGGGVFSACLLFFFWHLK